MFMFVHNLPVNELSSHGALEEATAAVAGQNAVVLARRDVAAHDADEAGSGGRRRVHAVHEHARRRRRGRRRSGHAHHCFAVVLHLLLLL